MADQATAGHIWDFEHPYYCSEGNYFATRDQTLTEYESWEDFYEEEGDSDPDLNLVFRFDWEIRDEDDDGEPCEPFHVLNVFWMGQRKGLYRCTTARVTPDDEPAVVKWLQGRYEHLLKLWTPFSNWLPTNESETPDA